MTTLEIILILIIWICYGIFNSYQHKWYRYEENGEMYVFVNILFAPIALIIRIIRGVFFWEGH